MRTSLDCFPCFGRNAVDAARRSTSDEALRRRIVSECFHFIAECDDSLPPPNLAREILDIALRHTGQAALFAEEKRKSNELAERIVADLSKIREYDQGNFESRLRLAVAGNILDFGVFANLDMSYAMEVVKSAFTKPLDLDAVCRLKNRMDSAKKILYVLDNCGEAVFDRIFLEPYRDKVTLCVRGREVLNDVTAADLPACGLEKYPYVTNGKNGIPGMMLSEENTALKTAMDSADLVIAKGQGNFETMNELEYPIAFLFLAKCPVVVRLLGVTVNSIQVRTLNF